MNARALALGRDLQLYSRPPVRTYPCRLLAVVHSRRSLPPPIPRRHQGVGAGKPSTGQVRVDTGHEHVVERGKTK